VLLDQLRRAVDGQAEPALHPLPTPVTELLLELHAPPRLGAHLRAVHDAAVRLVSALRRDYPSVAVDYDAVLFGAATHDIGKVEHPEELSGPGHAHEDAGELILLRHGVPGRLARFARTHARWDTEVAMEDLLVSVADTVWKGQRLTELEQHVLARLAVAGRQPQWEAFMRLDDILARIADGGDARLAFQASFSVIG
jgi:hypothetical protein